MPAREVSGWQAYYQIEPFGAWRDNFHAAMIAQILTNAHRKKNSPAPRMGDFFYIDPETRRQRDDAEMLAALESKAKDK